MLFSAVALLITARAVATQATTPPNFVFIITDDMDAQMSALEYMPLVNKYMVNQGTHYRKHYCTVAVCCPSRVSLLTGKAAHNTNVTDVLPPYGGYPKFVAEGHNENYLPIWLQEGGYSTYYTGKLFNAHSTSNYNNPYPKGWNNTEFLLDPFTYRYWNATFQSNQSAPASFAGQYNTDLIAEHALGFIDKAGALKKPFFIGVAPIGPHGETVFVPGKDMPLFEPPIAAPRHEKLFANVTVPRSYNFNPDVASGASYVKKLEKQNASSIAYGDEFYRLRLRSLQSIDEMVERIYQRLDKLGLTDNTYVIFTSDNGFHIGQHRLQAGKGCFIEEDINVPFIITGPGIPKAKTVDLVTTHTDIAPTLLKLAGIPLKDFFDGAPMPLTAKDIFDAQNEPVRDHVNVEFWGTNFAEGVNGRLPSGQLVVLPNNTYKALRVVGPDYSLAYSVWCTNEHELYDMQRDPGQMINLLNSPSAYYLTRPLVHVQNRLDALLMVLKSCKAEHCRNPWIALHPDGKVKNLRQSLDERYDDFYQKQPKIAFKSCALGYIVSEEGPQKVNAHDAIYAMTWH